LSALGLVLCLAAASTAQAADEHTIVSKSDGQARYTNVKYAYAVSYPPSVFEAEPESDSGDGKRLVSKDGKATILVYAEAAINTEGDGGIMSFRQLHANTLKELAADHKKISYKQEGKGWFVFSGTKGNKVFYQKCLYDSGIAKAFLAEYDQGQKQKYDAIVANSASSFKNVMGGWVDSKTMGSQSKNLHP